MQDYNTYIRQFPQVITAKITGAKEKPNFAVANEAQVSQAPKVDFGSPAPAAQPAPSN